MFDVHRRCFIDSSRSVAHNGVKSTIRVRVREFICSARSKIESVRRLETEKITNLWAAGSAVVFIQSI